MEYRSVEAAEWGLEITTNGICPIPSKGERWNHILRCEGTKISRDQIMDKKLVDIDTGIRMVGCKHEHQWQKKGIYMVKYCHVV